MKRIILCFTFLTSVFGAQSQNTNTYMNNYVQPAPNVAALGKYADYPVSYFTGVPEISIPIYNLKDGAVNLPVSLSYHASGIKVSEVASWVGLGWALNAGGMITRTVRGVPDEGTTKQAVGAGPRGYYLDSGIRKLPMLPHMENGGMYAGDITNTQLTQFTLPAVTAGGIEGEPDLYTFNFNGHSGKFVFDENRTARLLTDDDLQIAVNFSSETFQYWTITTADGVKYFFGENSMSEKTVPHTISSGDDPDAQRPSSWWLTRIVYPNTKDTVYFTYTPETYTYMDLAPESLFANLSLGPLASASDRISAICDVSTVVKATMRTTANSLRLTKIQSRNYYISFIANSQRTDISNYTTRPNRLDSVNVYTSTGQCISRYALNYSYFLSSLATQAILNNPSMPDDSSDTRRLKLLSMQEISGDGAILKPAYKFIYQDTFQLPRRLSYDQDHWGYSNNSAGNSNPFFTTTGTFAGFCSNSAGANRKSAWPQMEACTLLSVRDPLGVTTKFEFEANHADNLYPSYTVGGLRVKKIIVTDSLTGNQVVRKFQYSGGVVFKMPSYVKILKNEYLIANGLSRASSGYVGFSHDNTIRAILRESSSIVPLQDVQGNHIGYPVVTEIFGNNGEGGSKVYHFDMNLVPPGNSRLDISNYASFQYVQTAFYGSVYTNVGNGHFNDIAPDSLKYYNGYDVASYYPVTPDQIDLRRGHLLSESTYDSSGTLLKKIVNTYKDYYHENYQIRGFKAYTFSGYTIGTYADLWVTTPIYEFTFYKLHTGISHLTSMTEIDYKDGKTMTSISNYGYESAYHTRKTSDTTVNSAGDSIINKTYYSFDYANGATSDAVFGKMRNRFMLIPVATRVWKNNQLISGTIKVFKDFAGSPSDTFINPSKIYSLETSVPLTPGQANESVALTGQLATLIPNSYYIEKADFNYNATTGRITEQKLASNKNQALIWDNGEAVPLAVAENAYYSDIAYSSFESAETGNWAFGASSVVVDLTAPTGSQAYNLGVTAISKSGLVSANKYILSYWSKSGGSVTVTGGTQSNSITGNILNGWTFHQVTITGTTSVSITGSGNIDEVRLYPSNTQMITYSYDNRYRLVAQCSVNSTIIYYEYDGLDRLVDIKDQNGNIVKAFEYNYGRSSRSSQ